MLPLMITVLTAVQSPVHSSMTFPFTQLESTALSALLIGTAHHHRQISSPLLHHNFTISLTQALLATAHQTVLISLCSTQSPPSRFVGSMALLSLLLPSGYLSQMWKGTVTYLKWCSLYSWCQSMLYIHRTPFWCGSESQFQCCTMQHTSWVQDHCSRHETGDWVVLTHQFDCCWIHEHCSCHPWPWNMA